MAKKKSGRKPRKSYDVRIGFETYPVLAFSEKQALGLAAIKMGRDFHYFRGVVLPSEVVFEEQPLPREQWIKPERKKKPKEREFHVRIPGEYRNGRGKELHSDYLTYAYSSKQALLYVLKVNDRMDIYRRMLDDVDQWVREVEAD